MTQVFNSSDRPVIKARVKKISKKVDVSNIKPNDVVDRLYTQFPFDMARLAE